MTKEMIDRLESIAARDGKLRPLAVVDDARDPSSPLHSHFQWDDALAAEEHRLDQARRLIRSVKVKIQTLERVIEHVKYVRDPEMPPEEQGYVKVATLRTEEQLAREAVRQELTRALALLQRACDIAAALGLEENFRDVIARSEGLLKAVA